MRIGRSKSPGRRLHWLECENEPMIAPTIRSKLRSTSIGSPKAPLASRVMKPCRPERSVRMASIASVSWSPYPASTSRERSGPPHRRRSGLLHRPAPARSGRLSIDRGDGRPSRGRPLTWPRAHRPWPVQRPPAPSTPQLPLRPDRDAAPEGVDTVNVLGERWLSNPQPVCQHRGIQVLQPDLVDHGLGLGHHPGVSSPALGKSEYRRQLLLHCGRGQLRLLGLRVVPGVVIQSASTR